MAVVVTPFSTVSLAISNKYCGGKHDANNMSTAVFDLLNHVETLSSNHYRELNSCLITKYKSGTDHIPPHRD